MPGKRTGSRSVLGADGMRTTAYRWAIESGATEVAAWLNRRRAVILTYHGLLSSRPPGALAGLHKIFVPVDAFRAQMTVLRSRYRVVPLRELIGRLGAGDRAERLAAVTFDDGWRTTHTLAAPILKELGIPASVFVATGLCGTATRGLWTQRLRAALAAAPHDRFRLFGLELPADTPPRRAQAIHALTGILKRTPAAEREERLREIFRAYGNGPDLGPEMDFMSWEEVATLAKLGVELGAHTVDHEILSSLPLAEATAQIRDSRARLEEVTGRPCRLFAYPNGGAKDFTEEHARVLAESGFHAALTQIPGRNSPWTDPFHLRRINVGLDHTLHAFLAELDGLRRW